MKSLFCHIPGTTYLVCVNIAPQEYEEEAQKYLRPIEGKAKSFSMLSVFSSHHCSSCFPSGLIFAGASKFPLFNLRALFKLLFRFLNNDKREVQVWQLASKK